MRAGWAALPQGSSLRSGLFCSGPSNTYRPHPPHSSAHPDFTALRLRWRLQASKSVSHPVDMSRGLIFSALENAEAGRLVWRVQAHKIEDRMFQSNLARDERMDLALSLARTGRTEEAERLADEVSQEAPLDTIVHKYLVPTVRAAVKLQERDPEAAIDLLRETVQYDLAYTQSFDFLYPAYIRGLAYLELGDGRSAAREFQKLIDNPGLCGEFITGALTASTRSGREADGR
jgi:tetratricopeptide (TPR) repeat protein